MDKSSHSETWQFTPEGVLAHQCECPGEQPHRTSSVNLRAQHELKLAVDVLCYCPPFRSWKPSCGRTLDPRLTFDTFKYINSDAVGQCAVAWSWYYDTTFPARLVIVMLLNVNPTKSYLREHVISMA